MAHRPGLVLREALVDWSDDEPAVEYLDELVLREALVERFDDPAVERLDELRLI